MPIFMIGMQRSGSSLLRLMLDQLPDIAASNPPLRDVHGSTFREVMITS